MRIHDYSYKITSMRKVVGNVCLFYNYKLGYVSCSGKSWSRFSRIEKIGSSHCVEASLLIVVKNLTNFYVSSEFDQIFKSHCLLVQSRTISVTLHYFRTRAQGSFCGCSLKELTMAQAILFCIS